ncbi:MAG: UDP-N-acetylglucosamine--N-acetylmuramyl-(pentapeptide) pyrophosphoryl-undecaprenol N-acetylglucosamine transferase [Alphaproteobacteria bacterium MarineAlpha2_Bin1]|nr:MAG: UDP-N-acetylglucosamine--N-acetylmuramyl-(pentapeptide) pyrophosphoryl-undecaprenol N-acetylglucosamine transferase [Alphaproteobacteria bacterium MarineAlpha2_Bin1]|tara:strand:+ start:126 stop:1274 length:1149 start_codon:yes stop_codon:yes gene_type:complete
MNKKILFYVQHLLGIGHLKRASIIGEMLSKKGLDVTIISGGSKVSNLNFGKATFIQLPPTKSQNSDFSILLDEKGNKIDTTWKKKREKLIIDIFKKNKPEILITEMFPFGRSQMNFELLPLIEEAKKNNSIIISSIRDILISDLKKTKIERINFLLTKYYNYILVHGEERIYSIGKKLKLDKSNIKKLFYTGYICKKINKNNFNLYDNKEILVSAGGGAVGKKIIINAIKTSSLLRHKNLTWRIIIGINENNQNKEKYYKLAKEEGINVTLEPFSENFSNYLQNCLISVSQGGYNTMIEAVSFRVKSIIIPFSEDVKSDQIIRAKYFSYLNFITYMNENELNPSNLKTSIVKLMEKNSINSNLPNLNGAENTCKFMAGIINE